MMQGEVRVSDVCGGEEKEIEVTAVKDGSERDEHGSFIRVVVKKRKKKMKDEHERWQ